VTQLYVVTQTRPPRWVAGFLAALRSRGVAHEIVHAIAGSFETWSLVIGEERGGVPAFGDAMAGRDGVEVRLTARSDDGPARELRSGYFPYASRHARTLDRIADQCGAWLEQELRAGRSAAVVLDLRRAQSSLCAIDRARFYVREAVRLVGHVARYLFEETRWDVAVTRSSLNGFLQNPRAAWLHWIARTPREFLADPFLIRTEGGPQLLCETQHGDRTSLVTIDLNERFGFRTPMLPTDYSVSYPYVFEVEGEPWLVHEQHQRRRVDAYHLNGSATLVASWELGGIAVVDPTIVRHEGRWWLFCTDQDSGPNYALHVFWAASPYGPWHAHDRNPVKIDIGGARPAGNFFVRDGKLYRPAQDCAGRYGRAIVIQRVDLLTPKHFKETCVARIDSTAVGRKGAVGTHTLSHGHGWVALDAQFARWSAVKPLRLLRERLA
jgi:hypothetical protein